MAQSIEKASRKPRADSLRNREKLLDAAREVFRAGGPGASLEAVAKRAGVGIGTLYRHFPTRDDLFEAVYRREVEQLAELADTLSRSKPPEVALRQWLHANVDVVATKKGMLAALALAAEGRTELFAYSTATMKGAARKLLDRAIERGAIRDDISAEELMGALLGLVGSYYMRDLPDWQSIVRRLLDVFVDGLRAPRQGPRDEDGPN